MHDSKIAGAYITVNSKTLINLCSNDYLGIAQPKLSNKQNQSSSRLVSGNDSSFRILEEKLAKHKSQESSLIFPTGYMANLGVISLTYSKQIVKSVPSNPHDIKIDWIVTENEIIKS